MRTTLLCWLLYVTSISFAANIVDMYGADEQDIKKFLNKYSKQVIAIESELDNLSTNEIITDKANSKKVTSLYKRKNALIKQIKKEGGFLFVYIHTTSYPDEKNIYTTIEVVDKNQVNRLNFVDMEDEPKNLIKKNDIIDKMIEYDQLANKLYFLGQLDSTLYSCPVYHCVYGFKHPQLRPFLKIFNQAAIKNKQQIINVLKYDKDPERRAFAAFLVGHFQNPNEIISLLSTLVNDKSSLVRNNAVRVVGSTMKQAKITKIDVTPFLNLLNSPYGTDRNKALYVLFNAAEDKETKLIIAQKGKNNLLAMLKLKQPNNHENVYVLLKKLSGKNYAENDYISWDNWLSSYR